MEGPDGAGAEEVDPLEGQLEQGVLDAALHPGPHDPALFRAVGPGTGDVAEGHGRVQADQGLGRSQREVVGHALVGRFAESRRGDAEAEAAGVQARQLALNGRVVEEVRVEQLPQLGVGLPGGAAPDHEDL